MEELVQLTQTVMGSRCPSTKCKDREVTASSAELTDEGMSVSRQQQLHQLHYGMCRGRPPYFVLSHILDCIVDILDLMLRVVRQIFKFTASKHCDAAKQLELVKWVKEHLKVKLSSNKAGQSATGKAKIDLRAESWPDETCQVLMDNYVAIVQKAIPLWRSRHEQFNINVKKVWDLFFKLYYLITHGCDDKDEAAIQQHATEVEEVGNKMLTAFLHVANQQDVTVYIHCVHFFGRHRCNNQKEHAAKTITHAIHMRALSARTRVITKKGAAMRARAPVKKAAKQAASGVQPTKFTREHKSKLRVQQHHAAVKALGLDKRQK
eukprot:jgi/Tetstr1/456693/TSEL_043394.t1